MCLLHDMAEAALYFFPVQVFFCLNLSRFPMSGADCGHVDIDYSIRLEKALSCEKTN